MLVDARFKRVKKLDPGRQETAIVLHCSTDAHQILSRQMIYLSIYKFHKQQFPISWLRVLFNLLAFKLPGSTIKFYFSFI